MKELLHFLLKWGLGGCRIGIGLLVINAGYQLTQMQDSFIFWSSEYSISGIFVIIVGLAFIVFGLFPKFIDTSN
ncbi:hypothetical protein [Desulforhopalus sp. IMCC35007]|uniref:hypothetical protein n=1 Tax=Desulforhopalus sp. IMCC35007 TaxID=2569543 RepID=UPI0010ADE15A|nr:hypothetical protein [Desulforhopalus sp. IMCC35007]TKB05919.1 hypothetical protein FCL48_23010 [Desulforhopalus sp. IMCC35007]